MKYLRFWNRVFALFFLAGWAIWTTSRIGQTPTSCEPFTWAGAWTFVVVVAVMVFVGFMAGRESKEAA